MELKQLKCFLTVAQLKNFTRAAEFLYTSQSSLSYQIARLEEEIGGALFVRSAPVALTPRGESLLPHVENILRQVGNLSEIYRHHIELPSQSLHLGISDLGHECMFNACLEDMANFFEENRQIKLDAKLMSNDACKTGLLNGDLDLALITRVHMETLVPALDSKTVLLDRHVLVFHRHYQGLPQDKLLRELPLALHTGNIKGNRRIFSALGLEENYSNFLLADNLTTLSLYALSKRAIAIYPRSYFDFSNIPLLKAMEIDQKSILLKRDIAWNKQRASTAVRSFVQNMPEASLQAID